MPAPRSPILLLFMTFAIFPHAAAQSTDDEAYKTERAQAMALFNEQKHLEALPLFEDLAKKNPNDAPVLLGLASGLINHSATVTDPEAGKKELLRARELLLQAKKLGNNSILLQNLLDNLPTDGSIPHHSNPDVDKAMQAGEAAFAKRDFDEAAKNYGHALELDPKNYGAALFVADAYFAKKDFAKAEVGYDHAIQVNPNAETAYRYEADMFTKDGRLEMARARAIQAVIAEPYNGITWRGLAQWANSAHVKLVRMHIDTHADSTKTGTGTTITLSPNMNTSANAVWLAYGGTRALWQNEKFRKAFPQESKYRHSLPEESEALTLAAKMLPSSDKDPAYSDPNMVQLKQLSDAGMLEPYILLNGADQDITHDYAAYREKNRALLEAYLSKFVVPPAPAKP